jgi:hypothetical protein
MMEKKIGHILVREMVSRVLIRVHQDREIIPR